MPDNTNITANGGNNGGDGGNDDTKVPDSARKVPDGVVFDDQRCKDLIIE